MNPKILVFAASTRIGSYNRRLAAAIADALRARGADVTLADLRNYPMPLYDGDLEVEGGLPPAAKEFKELVRAHDVLVIASPEYNGSFPALLKNTIDWISRPEPGEPNLAVLRGKKAALLAASPGPGGGQRGLRHLRELLEMIGMTVITPHVSIPRVSAAFDETGGLLRPEDRAAVESLAVEIAPAAARACCAGASSTR